MDKPRNYLWMDDKELKRVNVSSEEGLNMQYQRCYQQQPATQVIGPFIFGTGVTNCGF